jgi:hypothetical protein
MKRNSLLRFLENNLSKRNMKKPLKCMLCKELESRYHLFFECVVARYVWANFASFFGLEVNDLSDVSRQWLNI